MMNMIIRPATLQEAPYLFELALRSKAHWGYDTHFIERWRPQLLLDFTAIAIAARITNVLEIEGSLAGYYRLLPQSNKVVVLDDLWLEPEQIGHGLGAILFMHARQIATVAGYKTMTLVADPHAVGFYEKMGAVKVGQVESTVLPGRMLPVMELGIQDAP